MSLYPAEGAHWWTENDHRAVVQVVRSTGARTVLEFGPGTSTLSLIEGGAERIDACEDDPHWFAVYCERLEDVYPERVRLLPYNWTARLQINRAADRYDLALIDGPRVVSRRFAVLHYCLARCDRVLIPLEEWDAEGDNGLRRAVCSAGWPTTFIDTGPLAGTFALMGPL
jgi:hypothetical protein